jgi:hypothetical protein
MGTVPGLDPKHQDLELNARVGICQGDAGQVRFIVVFLRSFLSDTLLQTYPGTRFANLPLHLCTSLQHVVVAVAFEDILITTAYRHVTCLEDDLERGVVGIVGPICRGCSLPPH